MVDERVGVTGFMLYSQTVIIVQSSSLTHHPDSTLYHPLTNPQTHPFKTLYNLHAQTHLPLFMQGVGVAVIGLMVVVVKDVIMAARNWTY